VEPAEDAIVSAKAGFKVKWLACLERVAPLTHNTLAIVRMQNTVVAIQLFEGSAGVILKRPINKLEVA
jgi:hypothetical protein